MTTTEQGNRGRTLALGVGAGLAVGLLANLVRKTAVQGLTVAAGRWDEALAAEHKAALAIFEALEKTTDKQAGRRSVLLAQLKFAISKHAFSEENSVYAQMLVRAKQSGRGLARRALAHELRVKGVDDDTAGEVLAAVDPLFERRTARLLVDKRLRGMHGLDVAVKTRRLAGMLARKGYPGDVALAVIRDAIAESPEHRRD